MNPMQSRIIPNIKSNDTIFFVLSLIMCFSSFAGVLKLPPILYPICLFLFLFYSLAKCNFKFRSGANIVLLFWLICLISIIINNPPSYFRAWSRLFMFIIMLAAFSPLLSNRIHASNQLLLCSYLINIIIIFTIGSFVANLLGINFFVAEGERLEGDVAGHFSGIMNHSMMLGALGSLSAIKCFSDMLTLKQKNKKIICGVTALVSMLAVFLSGSRGATGALFLGLIGCLYQMSLQKKKHFSKYILIFALLLGVLYPLIIPYASPVLEKSEHNLEEGGFFVSRERKNLARLAEIQDNFFTGVGYASVDPSLDDVDMATGSIEPGSSWLSIFSMTGVFGFIVFLIIVFTSIKKAFGKKNINYSPYWISGFLLFFLIHSLVEGYICAPGNILCCLFWLTLSLIWNNPTLFNGQCNQ